MPPYVITPEEVEMMVDAAEYAVNRAMDYPE
jgi:adenosylmethionine-8-amino-7-oxononanoate aminotransferase